MLIEAFKSLQANTSVVFAKLFNSPDSSMMTDVRSGPISTSADVRDAAAWLQREKFLNFSEMEVYIPQGMSCDYMTYIDTLEKVWMNYLSILDTGLFQPLSANLAIVANDPVRASTSLTINELNQKYVLRRVKPQDVKQLISKCFSGPKVDRTKMIKVFKSANNYEATLLRAMQLREMLTEKNIDTVKRAVFSINESINLILENEIDCKLAKHLHQDVSAASEWVELFGIFMLSIDEVSNALTETQKKVNTLLKKK